MMMPNKEKRPMNTLINLLKDHQVGKWCKLAAWVVAAIGLVNILLGVYITVDQYNVAGQLGQSLSTSIFLQEIRVIVSTIPPYIFYFFILYAVGVAIDHFIGNIEDGATDEDELEDEEESDLALDEEDGELVIVPGQME